MNLHFATSRDGERIAFETEGHGPPIILLHGGGQNRRVWSQVGWNRQLAEHFKLIAIDIRGHGESSKPSNPAAYVTDRLCEDILSVADAAGVVRFSLWGYSYGGNIARYLAAQSQRVERFALIGVSFGPSADDSFRTTIQQMQQRWKPILDADLAGKLDVSEIPEPDRSAWVSGRVRVTLAWLSALLEWPSIEPTDMQCPTLWLVGTGNASAMRGVQQYRRDLDQTRVRLRLVEGITHPEELEKIEVMLPPLLEFMNAY
jgi:pimeloyl-ACP methyl ester carboxylesterase